MSPEGPSVVCKVIHTTCAACGAFTEYDGTRAMNVRQLRVLREQRCLRCGERGRTVIAMLSCHAKSYRLRKLPLNPLGTFPSARFKEANERPGVVDLQGFRARGGISA
ncbi:hypothetical protein [Steroidobacter denitrificans]|nr:hypothetical protein [Steroidobacter denitrificans]